MTKQIPASATQSAENGSVSSKGYQYSSANVGRTSSKGHDVTTDQILISSTGTLKAYSGVYGNVRHLRFDGDGTKWHQIKVLQLFR
jgi:hypothetical protein